jgi:hypothetical protein
MAKSIRKRRTRSHIIADLSANHVEYFALKSGFSVEKVEADYGYDVRLYTYNNDGELENGLVYIQLKATDNIEDKRLKSGELSFSIEKQHLETWLHEPMPVILVLFDAQREKAYWLYMQLYFEQRSICLDDIQTDNLSVHLKNIVDSDAIKKWRDYKEDVLSQMGHIKRHV